MMLMGRHFTAAAALALLLVDGGNGAGTMSSVAAVQFEERIAQQQDPERNHHLRRHLIKGGKKNFVAWLHDMEGQAGSIADEFQEQAALQGGGDIVDWLFYMAEQTRQVPDNMGELAAQLENKKGGRRRNLLNKGELVEWLYEQEAMERQAAVEILDQAEACSGSLKGWLDEMATEATQVAQAITEVAISLDNKIRK